MNESTSTKSSEKTAQRTYLPVDGAKLKVIAFRSAPTAAGVVPVIRLVDADSNFLEMWLNGVTVEQAQDILSPGTTFEMDLMVVDTPEIAKDKDGQVIKTREGKVLETYRCYPRGEAQNLKSSMPARKAFRIAA